MNKVKMKIFAALLTLLAIVGTALAFSLDEPRAVHPALLAGLLAVLTYLLIALWAFFETDWRPDWMGHSESMSAMRQAMAKQLAESTK